MPVEVPDDLKLEKAIVDLEEATGLKKGIAREQVTQFESASTPDRCEDKRLPVILH